MKTNAQQTAGAFTCDCDISEPMTIGAKGGGRGGACRAATGGPVDTLPAVASVPVVEVVVVTVVVVVCDCVWSSRLGSDSGTPGAVARCCALVCAGATAAGNLPPPAADVTVAHN
jgi:hypothetical protein